MKKFIALFLCAILSLSIFVLPSSASPINAKVTVKMANIAPEMDGVVNAGEYGSKIHSVDYNNDEFIAEYDKDKSIKADFYMTWNQDSIYMAWVVHTDKHTPIDLTKDYNKDGKADAAYGGQDLGYMYMFSCVQFMICTGAPDINKKAYQTAEWSGNYLEAGLSLQNDGKSMKIAWSKPTGAEKMTVDSWDFCGSRDETKKTTTYETRIPLTKIGMQNIGEGTQFGLTYTIGDQENFDVAPNMCEWQNAIIGGKNMDAGAVITLSETTTDGLILGSPVENPDYNISVSAPTSYKPGDTVDVTISIKDITANDGYILIRFLLYYDSTKVEPVVTNDQSTNKQMNSFLKVAPDLREWDDGFCKLEEEYSRYDIAFSTAKVTQAVKENGSVKISIPFKVKNPCSGKIIFQVPHRSTMCVDTQMVKHYGNAGMAEMLEGTIIPDVITSKADSGLTVDGVKNRLLGLRDKTSADNLMSKLNGTVTVCDLEGNAVSGSTVVGTGYTVTNGNQTVTIVILGDCNGDGVVDSVDYLLAKKTIIGTADTTGVMLEAICISGSSFPDSTDYLKIKKYCIGTFDLYE